MGKARASSRYKHIIKELSEKYCKSEVVIEQMIQSAFKRAKITLDANDPEDPSTLKGVYFRKFGSLVTSEKRIENLKKQDYVITKRRDEKKRRRQQYKAERKLKEGTDPRSE